jgi:hypothetical protein
MQTLPAISLEELMTKLKGPDQLGGSRRLPAQLNSAPGCPARRMLRMAAVSVAVRAGGGALATSRARTPASAGSSKWFTPGLSVRLKW